MAASLQSFWGLHSSVLVKVAIAVGGFVFSYAWASHHIRFESHKAFKQQLTMRLLYTLH